MPLVTEIIKGLPGSSHANGNLLQEALVTLERSG